MPPLSLPVSIFHSPPRHSPPTHAFLLTAKRKASEEAEPVVKKPKVDQAAAWAGEGNPPTTTLWVGNLSWNVDTEWLKSEFEEFGEVTSTRIQMDRETGRSRGIGYVEFADQESATKGYNAQKNIDGRDARIDYATVRPPQEKKQYQSDRPPNPPAPTLVRGLPFYVIIVFS